MDVDKQNVAYILPHINVAAKHCSVIKENGIVPPVTTQMDLEGAK